MGGWPRLTLESSVAVFPFCAAPPWVCHLEKIYLVIQAPGFSVNAKYTLLTDFERLDKIFAK